MFDFYTWSRKLIIALVLLVPTCNAQDVRCDEPKPQLVLITQKPCPPCRIASALLDRMDLREFVRSEWDIRRDAGKIAKLGIGRVARTPVLVLLDIDGAPISSIETVDQSHVDALLASKPTKLEQPTVLGEFVETVQSPLIASDQTFGATVITFHIATEYREGYYNGTFAFGDCEYMLNSLGRYLNVTFQRTNRGQFSIVQSSRNGPPGAAAWTNGNVIRISPTFRFVNPVQCGMVTVHEFLHMGNGTSHHAQDGGIMGPNGGYLLLASDFPWMQKRGWKSALRPTSEPDWFKQYLSRNAVLGAGDEKQFPLMNIQRDRN